MGSDDSDEENRERVLAPEDLDITAQPEVEEIDDGRYVVSPDGPAKKPNKDLLENPDWLREESEDDEETAPKRDQSSQRDQSTPRQSQADSRSSARQSTGRGTQSGSSNKQSSGGTRSGGPDQQSSGNSQSGGPNRQSSGTDQSGGPNQQSSGTARSGGPNKQSSGTAQSGGPNQQSTGTAQSGGPNQQSPNTSQSDSPNRQSSGTNKSAGGGSPAPSSSDIAAHNQPPVEPPAVELTNENVSKFLAESLAKGSGDYGFDATLNIEGQVNRGRMTSDDVGETLETLLRWYARQTTDEVEPEAVLGIILAGSDLAVEYPVQSAYSMIKQFDLQPDDTISDLLSAIRKEGSFTIPPSKE